MYHNRPLISKRHYVLVDTKFNSLNLQANPTSRWCDIYCDNTFTFALCRSRLCPFSATSGLTKL